jgi:hypothetical protein
MERTLINAADKELAFLLFPGLATVYPHSLESILATNECNWTVNDAAAFRLMVDHGCYPAHNGTGSIYFPQLLAIIGSRSPSELIARHADTAAAARVAIVRAVIAKIKYAGPTEDDFLAALGPCGK